MAATVTGGRRNSNVQLLGELEELSQSLYQTTTTANRRTASLVLPRTSVPAIIPALDEIEPNKNVAKPANRSRARRMSLSPWHSRPTADNSHEVDRPKVGKQPESVEPDELAAAEEKKGIWNWKPIRAISHIGMQKFSCLFSVEVVTVQGLPASMNGLRLSVSVRKKETKEGSVHTMPSRVSQGAADFEETLFIRCHVYGTRGSNNKQLKLEPRPFLIYVFAVDAEELDFGKNTVDLSRLIQESIEKSFEGTRVRQWDLSFKQKGKAKGGELLLKLGFQIMEKDGEAGIYSQQEAVKSSNSKTISSPFARKQTKSSFSVPSPRMSSRAEAWTPSQAGASADFQGIDELNLDEPAPVPSSSPSVQKSEEPESHIEDLEIPDFEVVDKGVEIQDKEKIEAEEGESEISTVDAKSMSDEVVKEVVHNQVDPVNLTRLTELDAISQQIKALEAMMGKENTVKTEEETKSQGLDADEETVTMEFLQMLEDDNDTNNQHNQTNISQVELDDDDSSEADSKGFIADLGKGLGCVVQTRNGGYLAAMNPLDAEMAKKDQPKLAMQLSKPLVLPSQKNTSGFELFQKMAAIGVDELSSEIVSSMPMEELIGKTAEQIAFEGIASAIIHGRNKEGASSSAARSIAAVKTMASAMSAGRKERISTGIWNINEEQLTIEEILAYSMQKIEAMSIEALKIQAEMADEDAPFDVSPITGSGKEQSHPIASAIPLEDWIKTNSLVTTGTDETTATISLAIFVQLRDPLRRYEAVGGPVMAVIYATRGMERKDYSGEEKKFKLVSLHVAGVKVGGEKQNLWDSERQKLTAMQWLVAYGLGKAGKKGKQTLSKGQDLLWSISSRVMADMWLKPMRNPDVKIFKQSYPTN